jgi:nitrogen regulatory protein P-II 1
MKKIEAVIRMEKLTEVMDALEKIKCPGVMVHRIEGHGRQQGLREQFRGREYKVDLLPKIKLEIVTRDDEVTRIADCICATSRTGEIGDGKIFISTIDTAIKIRTGEKGDDAI